MYDIVDEQKYITTLIGRKRRLPEVDSDDYAVAAYAHRQAVNAKIQGSAADMIKVAMVKIKENMPSDCRVLVQVHDELIYEVPEAKAEEYALAIKDLMERPFSEQMEVPIIAAVSVADNWLEGK
jgi:DNA polymerase I